jgi:hypothetical protein
MLEQGVERGQMLAARDTLRMQLTERFGPLPEELAARIEATEELERLRKALRQVVHIQSLSELEV